MFEKLIKDVLTDIYYKAQKLHETNKSDPNIGEYSDYDEGFYHGTCSALRAVADKLGLDYEH